MKPLIVDLDAIAAAKTVREFAEANPIPHDEMLRIRARESNPPGDNPSRVVMFDMGYRVVFTVEHHPLKMRHISVSLDVPDKLITLLAFGQISSMFGFKGDHGLNKDQHVWIEDLGGGFKALNVVEPY